MEKERGESSWPHTALTEYVRLKSEYEFALGGKLNLFRFFIVRSLTLLKNAGRYGMIVPLALLADISCSKTRRYIMTNSGDLIADCFPQKDNPNRRVFLDAKLSTCVITCKKAPINEEDAQIKVCVYPWNKFEDKHRESVLHLSDIALLDPENTPIPLVDSEQWEICKKIYLNPKISRLGAITDFVVTRGEINQTIYREFITDNPQHAKLLKGVEVGQYHLNEKLSQGKKEWFDEVKYLKTNNPKSMLNKRRIVTQRITGVDERLRIVATIIDPPAYFADSTNSVVNNDFAQYKLEYLLGLLNSWLFQWRFKLTSSNNNVGTNELDSMPFCTINFSDPAEKAAYDRLVGLVESMLALHKQSTRTPQEKEMLARQIESTDAAIDKLVYALYGLTEEEIKIVEGKE
jgi:Alw26I/Eco31I/Esp3I family type II restriction m6 adenine DNA methyltransferase